MKVLLLTTTRRIEYAGTMHKQNLEKACAKLATLTPDTQYFAASIDDVSIQVKDGTVTVRDLRNNRDLNEYAFVHFLNVHFAHDHFMAVSLYLDLHHIPWIFETDVKGTAFSKISQMVLFSLHDIPVPDTLTVWAGDAHLREAQRFIRPPFIMKANDGTKGNDNYLVKSWDEYEQILRDSETRAFIVQPFHPNDGDYRFLYLGDQVMAFYRQSENNDTHLNNSSQGAQGKRVPLDTCDAKLLELAQKTMQVFGREIGGVDILVDKQTNKPYILEVNHTPAIFSGLFQDEKLAKYATFVQTKIKETS